MSNHNHWTSDSNNTLSFRCGHCGDNVASYEGYRPNTNESFPAFFIRICPHCGKPTFMNKKTKTQIPGIVFGSEIEFLPNDIATLYNEARRCFGINAFTSVIMCCRKLLMYIACQKGAGEGLKFVDYVEYLKDNDYVTKTWYDWVDSIRKMGNTANHSLECLSKDEAELVMRFTEMVLKTIFEAPGFHEQLIKKGTGGK